MKACVYCNQLESFNREHCIPEGLGKFKGHQILTNRICKICNRDFSIIEEQFLRASPEGFFRYYLCISGKSHHDKVNPFHRGSSGAPPLQILHKHPLTNFEIYWESVPNSKQFFECRQIIFKLDDDRFLPVPLPPQIKTEPDLVRQLKRFSIKEPTPIHIFASQIEWDQTISLLKTHWPNLDARKLEVPPITKAERIGIKARIDKFYFRAIAKIGFHYFLFVFSDIFSGHEPEFDPIKKFIKLGEGKIEDFVVQSKTHFFPQFNNFTPKFWGHFISVEKLKRIVSRIYFFIGPENVPYPILINLGESPGLVYFEKSFCHWYKYFPNGKIDNFDGEVEELTSIKTSLMI